MLNRTITILLAAACLALTVALALQHARPAAVTAPAAPAAPDVAGSALLDRHVGDVKWDHITLEEAITRLSDISATNICAEWRALKAIGVGRESSVRLHLSNATLGQALRVLVKNAQYSERWAVGFNVADGLITITDADAVGRHPTVEYLNIRPLLDKLAARQQSEAPMPPAFVGDSSMEATVAEDLESLIVREVDPDSWTGSRGTGTVRHVAGILIVSQTPENLRKIREFLARVDKAADRDDLSQAIEAADSATRPTEIVTPAGPSDSPPLITTFINIHPLLVEMAANEGPDDSAPNTRSDRIERLRSLLADIIALDTSHDSGGEAGVTFETSGILIITQTAQNLKKIREILRGLHVALHTNDFASVPDTTRPATRPAHDDGKTSAAQPVLEFINIKPVVESLRRSGGRISSARFVTDDLVHSITASVDPDSWHDAGGSGTINVLSGVAAVTQTPANQRAIRRFLAELARRDTPISPKP